MCIGPYQWMLELREHQVISVGLWKQSMNEILVPNERSTILIM